MIKCNQFLTVTGKVNTITEYNQSIIVFETDRKTEGLVISRKSLRKAIGFIFFQRTATRKDMEEYSPFSSALFGILFEVFKEICKVQRMGKGLLRLTLTSTRFIFSGLCRSSKDMSMIASEGGNFVMMSYYNLRIQKREKWLHNLQKYDLRVMIDSGAYSIHNRLNKSKNGSVHQQELFSEQTLPSITVEEYAGFINMYKNSKYIIGFFNLDVIGDQLATKKNYRRLKELTNAKIIPVWQVSDASYGELHNLVKESPALIAFGGLVPMLKKSDQRGKVKEILNKAFGICKDIPVHGLGIANDLIHQKVFHSVDSIAWTNARKNGVKKLYQSNGQKINAPKDMSLVNVLRQNVTFLARLEERYEPYTYNSLNELT
jgi:hypothetical protein